MIHQENQPVAEPAAQQEGETALQSEDIIQVKAYQTLDKVQKQLYDEAVRDTTRAKVIYKPMDTGISNPVVVSPILPWI